jgi:hypothetical protein
MVKSIKFPITSVNMPGEETTHSPEPLQRVPKVTLTAIGSGRKIDLRQTGTPTLLVCHGQNSADEATQVHSAVRERYPLASELMTASLVNLKIVPRMLRGVVEGVIRKAYNDAVGRLEKGQDPKEYIVILPDWDGSVTAALGLRNTASNAGIAILDGDGNLFEAYQGADLASTALSLLARYTT